MSQTKALFRQLTYGAPQLKLYLVGETSKNLKARAIRRPQEAAKLLAPLRHAAEEHFVSLHLNAKHEVIGVHEVSHGTLSASLVHPREVYKAALLANSFAILVCHNHPSGSSAALATTLSGISPLGDSIKSTNESVTSVILVVSQSRWFQRRVRTRASSR